MADIILKWLPTLVDLVEVSWKLLQLLTTGKLLHEGVRELSERHFVWQICVPLEGRSYQAGPEALAYACLIDVWQPWNPLLVGSNMVVWVRYTVVKLHVWEGKLLSHLYKGNNINKLWVSVAMWQTRLEWSWDPRDPLDHCFYPCQPIRHCFLQGSHGGWEKGSVGNHMRHGTSTRCGM